MDATWLANLRPLAKDLRHTLEIAMTTRRSPLVCNLLAAVTAGCLAFSATQAFAAPKKRPPAAKAEAPAPAKTDEAAPAGERPPAAAPAPAPAAAPAPAPAATPAAAEPAAPVPAADRTPLIDTIPAPEVESQFEGGFFRLNLGYAGHGGEAGPAIPDMTAGSSDITLLGNNTFASWRQKGCLFGSAACYKRAIRSDVGSGVAVALQGGYNIKGYVSIWGDLSWHGSFGSKKDIAGAGTAAVMLGLHPLRFWRADLPVDVMVYGGYGFFEILYYYETEFQTEAKGKAWTGSSIPFGLLTEYRFRRSGPFAMGLDLRLVNGRYNKWIYNNDKDYSSNLGSDPHTTLRFEPRLTMGWHF